MEEQVDGIKMSRPQSNGILSEETCPLNTEEVRENGDIDVSSDPDSNKSCMMILLPTFIGMLNIFGWGLYTTDVVTDIWTGVTFITGKNIEWSDLEYFNYTNETCAQFATYSHIKWGSLCIFLAWAPGMVIFPSLLTLWQKLYTGRLRTRNAQHTSTDSWVITMLLSTILILFWPLAGVIL